ncbi:tRNA preQ1(34) S-adenosylmethionine ribosyltransferase-isomerase QueA [Helicobacter anatolicus]|uniref:tRNA preQ1(34) S-adenosylmethionine ribosyltransferase-isomerase QueA n=1 Tax=Helicobacter anatolicus TaxID=2905874 RepID=UPI001E3F1DD2|nr:tRNA preQ1(34) S-adenosylmethionine ribosyltransferase-isomerase QueA [Helicobacter anatolicus]MCE3038956.1 tRNA preQ1(34) S-adenosylmethionine ribosyltransferase-isomerase QueA [Helicobacter anatolicus]
MKEFLLESYDYDLPQELIATYPLTNKEDAKLLIYYKDTGSIEHVCFKNLFDFIPKDYLIVFNDTKVIKARIYGEKKTGAKIEIFFHKALKEGFLVQMRGRVRIGDVIYLAQGYQAKVKAMFDGGFRIVEFFKEEQKILDIFLMFEEIGHIPLPPYIKREDEKIDLVEYQSVFASYYGAVAAPTASLHFSESMKSYALENYQTAFLTLHVGAGTFIGVEASDIREHKIHKETLKVSKESMQKIKNSQKILCVGTTALRSVEFLDSIEEDDFFGDCDIFLHCGNPPKKAQALLTNFHLPKSSLIMLVASMIGLENCHRVYQEAIRKKYRFYSYGDGMLIV